MYDIHVHLIDLLDYVPGIANEITWACTPCCNAARFLFHVFLNDGSITSSAFFNDAILFRRGHYGI